MVELFGTFVISWRWVNCRFHYIMTDADSDAVIVILAAEIMASHSAWVSHGASLLYVHWPDSSQVCRQMSGESNHWWQTDAVYAATCSGSCTFSVSECQIGFRDIIYFYLLCFFTIFIFFLCFCIFIWRHLALMKKIFTYAEGLLRGRTFFLRCFDPLTKPIKPIIQ